MTIQKRKSTLIFTTAVALLAVFSLGVSTYAWFQANADVNITTTSDEAEITVSAPEEVKFYRFKGNGVPGSSYYGYSLSGGSIGNTTNLVDTSTNKYKLGAESWVSYDTNTWNTAWTIIDKTDSSDVQSAFNLSMMRPGCYYSFCIDCSSLSTAKLQSTFNWSGGNNVIGSANSIKRYIATVNAGVVTKTDRPLNLLLAINGYGLASTSIGSDAASFINGTTTATTSSDKIIYDDSLVETSHTYTLLDNAGSGVDVTTNNHIYFTIFMGYSTKDDALMYRDFDSSNNRNYYEKNNSSGSYGPLDGLKSTLSSISIA